MKTFVKIIIGILVVCMLVLYVPQFFHSCTGCESFFLGLGYEENIIVDAMSEDDGVLCRDCAEYHHALSIGFGKSIDDYSKPFVWNPLDIIEMWIG